MKLKRRIYTKISVMLSVSLLSMCFAPHTPNASAAAKIKLNKTKLTLKVGKTYKLKLSKAKKKIKWTSSKKKVASVTAKGKVKAKKVGKTTITAKCNGKKYKCKVTVKKAATTSATKTSSASAATTKATKAPSQGSTNSGGSSQNPATSAPTQKPGQSTASPGTGQNPGQNTTTSPGSSQNPGQNTGSPGSSQDPADGDDDSTPSATATPVPTYVPRSPITVTNNPANASALEQNIALEYELLAYSILITVENQNEVWTDEGMITYHFIDNAGNVLTDDFVAIQSMRPGEKISIAIPVDDGVGNVDTSASTIYVNVSETDDDMSYLDLTEEVDVTMNDDFDPSDAILTVDFFNHSRYDADVTYMVLCYDVAGTLKDAYSDTITVDAKDSGSEDVWIFMNEDMDTALYKDFEILYIAHATEDIDPYQEYIDNITVDTVSYTQTASIEVTNNNEIWLTPVEVEYFLYDSKDNLVANDKQTFSSLKPDEVQYITVTGTSEEIGSIDWKQSYFKIEVAEPDSDTDYIDLRNEGEEKDKVDVTTVTYDEAKTSLSVGLFNHSRYDSEVSYTVFCYGADKNVVDIYADTLSLEAKSTTTETVTFSAGSATYEDYKVLYTAHGAEEIDPNQPYIDNLALTISETLKYTRVISVVNKNADWLSSLNLEYCLYDEDDNSLMNEDISLLSLAPNETQYVTISGTPEVLDAIDWDRSYVNIDLEPSDGSYTYGTTTGSVVPIAPSTYIAVLQSDNTFAFTIQNTSKTFAVEGSYLVYFLDDDGNGGKTKIGAQYGTYDLAAGIEDSLGISVNGPDDPTYDDNFEAIYPAKSAQVSDYYIRHTVVKNNIQ